MSKKWLSGPTVKHGEKGKVRKKLEKKGYEVKFVKKGFFPNTIITRWNCYKRKI